jgi:hypothetical protein
MAKQALNPSPEAVTLWLKQIDHAQLRDSAWIVICERFHGLTDGASPFLLQHYADEKERQAAFDGFTLALLAVAHFEDIERLSKLFTETASLESGPKLLPDKL